MQSSKTMENQLKINSKSRLLHALRTVGGGVANNINDASHLPQLAESLLFIMSYKL